jgi:hypothetical protein
VFWYWTLPPLLPCPVVGLARCLFRNHTDRGRWDERHVGTRGVQSAERYHCICLRFSQHPDWDVTLANLLSRRCITGCTCAFQSTCQISSHARKTVSGLASQRCISGL